MRYRYFGTICALDTLQEAWEQVRRKGKAGGIDHTTVDSFAEGATAYLEALAHDLKTGAYVPEPYLQVQIPKSSGKGQRQLSLPAIRDKVVQQAVRLAIEPDLERLFLNTSYAYRPHKGAFKAIQRVRHLIGHEGRQWVVHSDVRNFFDEIDHTRLLARLGPTLRDEKVLELIRLWISMARIGRKLDWQETHVGIPQGNVISPLLSNFYLHPLDALAGEEGWGYVRYADNFILLMPDQGSAEQALARTQDFAGDILGLRLHEETEVVPAGKGFTFLGVAFTGADTHLSPEKYERLRQGLLKQLKLQGTRLHPDLIRHLRLIHSYYGRLLPEPEKEKLDHTLAGALVQGLRQLVETQALARKSLSEHLFIGLPFCSQAFQEKRKQKAAELLRATRKQPAPSGASVEKTQKKIQQKKQEYLKKAAEVRELLITQPGVYLGKRQGRLLVKKGPQILETIPFAHLHNLTIQSRGVALSTDVLFACAQHKITIDLLTMKGKPFAKVLAPQGQSQQLAIAQVSAYRNGKAQKLAQLFVEGKIRNQINFIKYLEKYEKRQAQRADSPGADCLHTLGQALEQARSLTEKQLPKLRASLMAAEGRAAKAYWAYIQWLIAPQIAFEGRARRGATDPVNSALNYGYGILYGRIWEAVARAQLMEGFSYLHSGAEDRDQPSLTFDLIEEFRVQAVDRPVMAMIGREGPPKVADGLLTEDSRKLLARRVLERLGRIEAFRGERMRLQDIILGQARHLADYLTGETKQYRPYIRKW